MRKIHSRLLLKILQTKNYNENKVRIAGEKTVRKSAYCRLYQPLKAFKQFLKDDW